MSGRLRQAIEDLIYDWESGCKYSDIDKSFQELKKAMEEEE